MINEKSITLRGGRVVLVQEVTVRRMLQMLPFLKTEKPDKENQENSEPAAVDKSFLDNADEFLRATCGLTVTEMHDLYPSDLQQLWDAFQTVNSFFFGMAEKLGLTAQLGTMIRSILDGVGGQLADSLKTDMQVALSMVSAGSSAPSNTPGDLTKLA